MYIQNSSPFFYVQHPCTIRYYHFSGSISSLIIRTSSVSKQEEWQTKRSPHVTIARRVTPNVFHQPHLRMKRTRHQRSLCFGLVRRHPDRKQSTTRLHLSQPTWTEMQESIDPRLYLYLWVTLSPTFRFTCRSRSTIQDKVMPLSPSLKKHLRLFALLLSFLKEWSSICWDFITFCSTCYTLPTATPFYLNSVFSRSFFFYHLKKF